MSVSWILRTMGAGLVLGSGVLEMFGLTGPELGLALILAGAAFAASTFAEIFERPE